MWMLWAGQVCMLNGTCCHIWVFTIFMVYGWITEKAYWAQAQRPRDCASSEPEQLCVLVLIFLVWKSQWKDPKWSQRETKQLWGEGKPPKRCPNDKEPKREFKIWLSMNSVTQTNDMTKSKMIITMKNYLKGIRNDQKFTKWSQRDET